MLDDVRNHDSEPTAEESDWMSGRLLGMVFRAAMLAVLSMSIGAAASFLVDAARPVPALVTATPGA